jgi:hypothetical protein
VTVSEKTLAAVQSKDPDAISNRLDELDIEQELLRAAGRSLRAREVAARKKAAKRPEAAANA